MNPKLVGKRKGKGKEVGLGKDMMLGDKRNVIPVNISSLYEGSLDSQFFVITAMRDGQKTKGRIIECRESRRKPAAIPTSHHVLNPPFRADYGDLEEKNEYSYDYYIHFEGFNRRNDMWVTRENIETVTPASQQSSHSASQPAPLSLRSNSPPPKQ